MQTKFLHLRRVEFPDGVPTVATKGGVTIAYQQPDPKDPFYRVGVAVCGKREAYNRKLGRTIAMGRMMDKHTQELVNLGSYPPIKRSEMLAQWFCAEDGWVDDEKVRTYLNVLRVGSKLSEQ